MKFRAGGALFHCPEATANSRAVLLRLVPAPESGVAFMFLVALTGWGQEQDRRQATEAGFNCHLVKPGDPQIIGALIEQTKPHLPAAPDGQEG